MNYLEFNNYWDKYYPESNLIGHKLKSVYPERWLRIHSLPNSKRYAQSDDDYQLILERQNKLISELFGDISNIVIVTGQYEMESTDEILTLASEYGVFKKCRTIELHKIYPEEYENDFFYSIYFRLDKWRKNGQNKLLKSIADDNFRAIFISQENKSIVAPYDGGLDIIVESQKLRNHLKLKYKDWLSTREDGY